MALIDVIERQVALQQPHGGDKRQAEQCLRLGLRFQERQNRGVKIRQMNVHPFDGVTIDRIANIKRTGHHAMGIAAAWPGLQHQPVLGKGERAAHAVGGGREPFGCGTGQQCTKTARVVEDMPLRGDAGLCQACRFDTGP